MVAWLLCSRASATPAKNEKQTRGKPSGSEIKLQAEDAWMLLEITDVVSHQRHPVAFDEAA